MAKINYQFEDFLNNVEPQYRDFVNEIHELLMKDNYKIKIEEKATGFFVSYEHPKTKRNILNFLFRKKGLFIRLYGENCNEYQDVLNELPQEIINQIDKAGVCKRIIDPQACNPRCSMGYDFYMIEKHYQKCRNSCFYLFVDLDSVPFLFKLIESENKERNK